ncbi:MAG: uroporphyrinogen-III C-methyltransferase, partial [Burkholderiaceae bacterium]
MNELPPASTASDTAAAPPQPSLSKGMARGAWLVVILVLAALCVGSLLLAWKTDQRVLSLEQELVRRQQASADQSAEARLLAKQAQEGTTAVSGKVALLEARVAEVAAQRSDLDDLLQSLARSRDENLLVDVEAVIRAAMQQAAITGSAAPLVAALKQSDERLARQNLPRLEGLRRAIARDLDRVTAAHVPDIATLSLKLDEVIRLIDELPLVSNAVQRPRAVRSAATPERARRAAAAASHPGLASSTTPDASTGAPWLHQLGELWSTFGDHVWSEVRSLVRVTRIDQPNAMLIAPEQTFFLRENLKLRLLNARVALLSRQFDTVQADLQVAHGFLSRYFDNSAQRTMLASDLVRQVAAQARPVGVPRPDDT